MLKFVRNCSLWTAAFVLVFLLNSAVAQQFVNSGQSFPGLYAGSVQWGFFDGDAHPDALLTGLDDTGDVVTLIYQNVGGTLTPVEQSITGVYFGEAAWGDYDNDGDLDVVVIGLNGEDNSIAEIWKNDNGIYVRDDNQKLTGLRYATASWADYNNDGLLDLITTGMDRFGESKSILYKNQKVGLQYLLSEETLQQLLNISKGSAAFGDIDNDGDLDLVLSGIDASGFPNAAVYVNDPAGFFTYDNRNSPVIRKLSSGSLIWGDADGDGFSDLLQTGLNSFWETEIVLYENEHIGTIAGNLLESATGVAGTAIWGDFGNNGISDIAVAGKDNFSNVYGNTLVRQPDGTFTENLAKFAALRDGAIATADYNLDGKIDLLISGVNSTGEFETVLYRNTTAALGATPEPPGSLHSVTVTNNQVILSWDKGSDALTPDDVLSYNVRVGTQSAPNQVQSGVAPVGPGNVGMQLRHSINTQLAEGVYTFSVQSVNAQYARSAWSQEKIFRVEQFVSSLQNISGFQFVASEWGDYDNDGDPDLVVAGTDANGHNRTLLYNNEDGVLVEDRTVNNNLIKFNYGDFSWGDYDNDGDLDLAYTGFFIRESATSGLYVNNDGVLNEMEGVFTAVGFASLDWGDYDSDGDLDLAVMGKTTAGPFITKIFRNDGGVLIEDTNQSLIGYALGTLQWADYDNDGDLDLSIVGQSANGDNKLRLYKNDPAGTLTEDPANTDFPAFPSSDLAWADIDDDGDLDLIVTGVYQNTTDRTVIFRNFPTGNLLENATLSANLQGGRGGALVAGDYDNDGDPDIIVTGFDAQIEFQPILKLYKNNSIKFDEEVLTITQNRGVDFSAVSLVDIDNDGDLELVALGRMKSDETTFPTSATVYDNVSARSNPNSPPQDVTGLGALVSGGTVTLSWAPAIDFPVGDPLRDSLSYQIRVGSTPDGNEIISGAQVPAIGRFGSRSVRTVTGLTSDDYYWSVRAIDNGLAVSGWSSEQTFRVDTDPPSVVSESITITPDSAGVGTVTMFIAITENFGLDNLVLPTVTAVLPDASQVPVSMLSYSGNTWIGELEILEQYSSGTVNLNVSGVTDAFDNVMMPVEAVKNFYIDTERPQVIETDPPFVPGAVQEGVKTNITLTATFSEPLNPASIEDDVLKLFRGSQEVAPASSVQLSSDGLSVSALYSSLKSETEYRAVVVSTIRDRVGNIMDGDFSWEFKTTRIVSAQTGGSVFTADSSVVLYLSPNAISADVEIPIDAIDPFPLPENLAYVNVAFNIGPPGDLELSKPAQLQLQYSDVVINQGSAGGNIAAKPIGSQIEEDKLAIYRQQSTNLSVWERIGGTVNTEENVVSAPVSTLGTFGLFEDLTAPAGAAGITDVSFSPRVFSPQGTGFLPKTTSINYVLGTATDVTIIIFNTAGRPVKQLLNNQPRSAGAKAEIWDGKDGDGRVLPTGLYIVLIKAGGATETKTVAISNQ